MPHQPTNGILEEFRIEFLDCWKRLPNKAFFLCLLLAWLALFQFYGNSALGYIRTPSLLGWMWSTYSANSAEGVAEEAHGKLIPLVVLGLLWWKRKELLATQPRLWSPGLALVGLGLLLHFVGFAVEQSRISVIGLFTGIYGLMGLAWGPGWLRRSTIPFALFVFCVPLGSLMQPITFPLRVLVCKLVLFLSNSVLGIGILSNGTDLRDPMGHYSYDVAAPCSGIQSLIATALISLIYALVSFRSKWRVGVMLLAALPFAVAGNTLRLMCVVLAAELGGQGWGQAIHDGWPGGISKFLPYVPAFLGVMLVGRWLREPRCEVPQGETAAGAAEGTTA